MKIEIATDLDALWFRITGYLAQLPDWETRQSARHILINRLKHPELGSQPETAENVHPKAGTNLAGHRGGLVCICGSLRRAHDIDGLRWDCDGYMEAP